MNNQLFFLVGGLAIAGGLYWRQNQPKRWIFQGQSRTARELEQLGMVQYGDNWVPADYLNQELNQDQSAGDWKNIIASGIGLFNDATKVIADLKGMKDGSIPKNGKKLPCAIFVGVSDVCD
ncbi:MAG: hypothetical protein AAGJ18_21060 [Bacteroidota bacterium]